jgi:hypothetical protein
MGELPRLFLYTYYIQFRPKKKKVSNRETISSSFLLSAGNEPLTTCEIDNFKPSAYTQPNGGEIVV